VNIFILWDDSRVEHGEKPDLVEVFESKEGAEAEGQRLHEALDDEEREWDENFLIEERETKP
jgi:hypothetical protein